MPVSVSVPVPDSVNPPVPPTVPPNVPLPEPPSVSVLPPRFTVEPDTPDSAPVVCGVVAALTSSVEPVPARSTALPDERLPPAPTANVLPLPIVVLPV
ncbi:conserved hypothetical protein [Burkholderia ambifaria IOP40-10]|uniref:Uncharacterized protein n=1 Tax=Burkholderia ambifaria IOP40-10 TaxID=396596 RepID=B1FRS5_9BURK|nr:conserved hypothetical protein [Burkholderia ambifaria IOP40-10]